MNTQTDELKRTASQLLAAMLSNPHIYPQLSDAGGYRNMERQFIIASVEMAGSLIQNIGKADPQSERQVIPNKKE
jgi:hypothetical protein